MTTKIIPLDYQGKGYSRNDAITIRKSMVTKRITAVQADILRGRNIKFDEEFEKIEAGDSVYHVYYTEKGPVWFYTGSH